MLFKCDKGVHVFSLLQPVDGWLKSTNLCKTKYRGYIKQELRGVSTTNIYRQNPSNMYDWLKMYVSLVLLTLLVL